MNDLKENLVTTLYHELLYYDEDLYKISRTLVKILPRRMIIRVINKFKNMD